MHSPEQPPLTLPALPEAYTHRLESRRYLSSPETAERLERAQPIDEDAISAMPRRDALCAVAQQTRTEGGGAIVSRKWWRASEFLAQALQLEAHA